MKILEKYLDEIINREIYEEITIVCRDDDNHLTDLLQYIERIGNIGHSFNIIVDPDDSEYRKEFFWDGDGSDYIKSIERK